MAANNQIPPEAWPLLNAIRQVESANQYDRMYGNQQTGIRRFTDFSRHPNSRVMGPDGPSSAAGGYQLIKTTWDRAATALGLTDFLPPSQDRAAWWVAQNDYRSRTGRDLAADLRAGRIEHVRSGLSPTWRALRDNPGGFMSAYSSSPQASTGTTDYQSRVGSTAPQPGREALTARQKGESPVLEAIRQRLHDRGRETPFLDRWIENRRQRAQIPRPFVDAAREARSGAGYQPMFPSQQPTPGPLAGRQDKGYAPALGQGVDKTPPAGLPRFDLWQSPQGDAYAPLPPSYNHFPQGGVTQDPLGVVPPTVPVAPPMTQQAPFVPGGMTPMQEQPLYQTSSARTLYGALQNPALVNEALRYLR